MKSSQILPSDSDSLHENVKFSTKALRQAFDVLKPKFGSANMERLTRALEAYGVQLSDNTKSYSMSEIKPALDDIFSDAAPLILEDLKKALLSESDLSS